MKPFKIPGTCSKNHDQKRPKELLVVKEEVNYDSSTKLKSRCSKRPGEIHRGYSFRIKRIGSCSKNHDQKNMKEEENQDASTKNLSESITKRDSVSEIDEEVDGSESSKKVNNPTVSETSSGLNRKDSQVKRRSGSLLSFKLSDNAFFRRVVPDIMEKLKIAVAYLNEFKVKFKICLWVFYLTAKEWIGFGRLLAYF